MTHWLTEPFAADLVLRALAAGMIAACLCATVGCWVLLRGSVFLGEAMSHGMLPGVAFAALVGTSLIVGGLVAALVMAVGIAAIGRSSKLSSDTSIGLLLVGMLSLGVIVVSRSQGFAVDLTSFLFGDVLAIRTSDLAVLGIGLAVTLTAVTVGHRAFVAVTFDPRKAATLGLRPALAIPAMTVLMAVAMVASFHVVGTLLVLALLVAPPATALAWAHSIPRIMLLSAVFGSAAVYFGLIISWHAGTAGGATIAGVAVLLFFASTLLSLMRTKWRRVSAVAATAAVVAGCAGGATPAAAPTATAGHDEVVVDGARELDGPLTKLVLVDSSIGDTSVYDAVDESETPLGSRGPVSSISGDGRFAYLRGTDRTAIVDAGAWTFDHGDHYHYFATEAAVVASVPTPVASVAASNTVVALESDSGAIELLNRETLGDGNATPVENLRAGPDASAAVPYRSRLITASDDGRLRVVDEHGDSDLAGRCPAPSWTASTRRAVVIGCEHGAVRVTGGEGNLTVTAIPFPHGAPAQRPEQMEHRDRADVFAGLSDATVWVLDSGKSSWTLLPVPDAVAVNTAGDGTVLVLHRDGTLASWDVRSGTETARVPLLNGGVPDSEPFPVIEIDSDRAYVNNAAAREVYEIDYADQLRVARTLRTTVAPRLMVEAGR